MNIKTSKKEPKGACVAAGLRTDDDTFQAINEKHSTTTTLEKCLLNLIYFTRTDFIYVFVFMNFTCVPSYGPPE